MIHYKLQHNKKLIFGIFFLFFYLSLFILYYETVINNLLNYPIIKKAAFSSKKSKPTNSSSSSSTTKSQIIKRNCKLKNILLNNKWPTFSGPFLKGKIPQVVHYTSSHITIPQQYKLLMENCIRLNPNVTFLLWTDEFANEFVHQKAKNDFRYQKLHKTLLNYRGIKKGDIIRLIVMHFIGGIYMDLDMECKQSFKFTFNDLSNKHADLRKTTCLFDREEFAQARILYNRKFTVMNNFIVCEPGHPFVSFVLENLPPVDMPEKHPVAFTGPIMLTNQYRKYQIAKKGEDISLADPHWFSPLADSWKYLRKICLEKQGKQKNWRGWIRRACEIDLYEYILEHNSRSNSAYLIHRFLHLGYDNYKDKIKELIDVCDSLEKILVPIL